MLLLTLCPRALPWGSELPRRHSNPITTWVADQREGAAFFLLQVLGAVSRDKSFNLPVHCSLP